MLTRPRTDIPLDHYMALVSIRDDVKAGNTIIKMDSRHTCIYAEMRERTDFSVSPRLRDPIYEELFFPPILQLRSWFFTPQKNVVRAIDRFLANKKPWGWW